MNMGLGVQPDSQTGADYSPDQDRGGTQARRLCFGVFQLDLLRQRLFKDGTQVKMQGKVYQALIALIETPGEIVTRDALRTRLWPRDTHLNYDANVNTTVNKLRQVLGDTNEESKYIETIPRTGSSFVARVDYVDGPTTVSDSKGIGGAGTSNVEVGFFTATAVSEFQPGENLVHGECDCVGDGRSFIWRGGHVVFASIRPA